MDNYAPWADEPTTWVEDDYFPDKVKINQGTRASSSAIRIPRDQVPTLIQQLIDFQNQEN